MRHDGLKGGRVMRGVQRCTRFGGLRSAGTLILLLGWLAMPLGFLLEMFAFAATRPAVLTGPGSFWPALWRPVAAIVLGLLGLAVIVLARQLRRQGKRMLSSTTTAEEVLTAPPFVLYLRSFTDDPRLASSRPHTGGPIYDASATQSVRTEEEQLRLAVAPFGPMVAVGRPGESLPEIGARRLYLEHDNWRESVLKLMNEAGRTGLVLMSAGLSASLAWELGRAAEMEDPRRLVLMIAMDNLQYEKFRETVGPVFPRKLPPWPQDPPLSSFRAALRGAIYFDTDWTPNIVRFDSTVARGNRRRVIESHFVYDLHPVYEQLEARWPGLCWLPRRIAFTRREIPYVAILLMIGVAILAGTVHFLLTVPTYILPLFGFLLVVSVVGVLRARR